MLEVEIKAYPGEADRPEKERIISRLEALGFKHDHSCDEADSYYQAPDRDFRKTDEALRIRIHTEAGISHALVTYKGPKLDTASHMRHEVETEIPDSKAAAELFAGLGYKAVFTVSKHREVYINSGISVCLDDVEGLGFAIEIEKLISEEAGEAEKSAAREEVLHILDELEISRDKLTMKTYLEMLLNNH